MTKTNVELIREFFTEFGEYYDVPPLPELTEIHLLSQQPGQGNRFGGQNYRLTFADGSIGDWRIQFDEDSVIDAYEYNAIISM